MSVIALVVMAVIYKFFIAKTPKTAGDIDANEFEERIKQENVVILDVRSSFEFKGEKINGAQNISYSSQNFGEKIIQLDKSKTYLVYCATGSRSAGACNTMNKMGFDKVYNLLGGISSWKSSGKQTFR